jgi:hypothetical protein
MLRNTPTCYYHSHTEPYNAMSLMIHGDSGGDYRLCYPVSAHWSTQAPTNQSTSQSPKTRAKSQSRASPQVIDPPTKPPALNNLPVAEAKGGLPLANPKGDGSIISRLKKAIIIKTDMGVEQVSEYLCIIIIT